jgi:hypothetical protein
LRDAGEGLGDHGLRDAFGRGLARDVGDEGVEVTAALGREGGGGEEEEEGKEEEAEGGHVLAILSEDKGSETFSNTSPALFRDTLRQLAIHPNVVSRYCPTQVFLEPVT